MTPDAPQNQMLIIASAEELPASSRIWGTGGWLPPESREALDWLTLAILSGWQAAIAHACEPANSASFGAGSKWIIVACDPDQLGDEHIKRIAARLETEDGLLVIARAGAPGGKWAAFAGAARGTQMSEGRLLQWRGPGSASTWRCRKVLESNRLARDTQTAVWAMLDVAPAIVARSKGRGIIATLAFHPSETRDREGVATALLRHLLVCGITSPVAWFDWHGTMVLRMDDPGCAQHLYLRSWLHPKLTEEQWREIATVLHERNGRLSIGYVSGWVDDGCTAYGELRVGGALVDRIAGRIHPAPTVRYRDASGAMHDYEAEYRGIQSLRAVGLADVELHGYTHIHPDRDAWLGAPDRYDAPGWFRELGRAAEPFFAGLPLIEHPLARGIEALRAFYGVTPTTLICPGEEFTNPAIETALDLGLRLIGSYYLAVREADRFCWTQHVCAPYLDQPDPSWFDSGLPVVGYFHDRDLALEGVGWLAQCLDQWAAAGAKRLIDYRELAAACNARLQPELENSVRVLRLDDRQQPVRPLPVLMAAGNGRMLKAGYFAGDHSHIIADGAAATR